MPFETSVDDFALARRSTPLAPLIREEIERDGPITFARFMSFALGHPEHGYYSRERIAWGHAGDYETSPEVHPIFGYLWARQVVECWERLGRPEPFALIEPGAGSGAFAASLLTWLAERAPDCYAATRATLLDGHPHRLAQQCQTLTEAGHTAAHLLADEWLASNGAEPIVGVVISNEYFDALPVHVVERQGSDLLEWHVRLDAETGLAFELLPPSAPALAAHFAQLGIQPGDGCRAEVSLAALDAMRQLAARVERGYIVTIDYGYDARTLYAPWRRMGTLMAFRNHSPQPDPLAEPGRLDLTAHVDLTSLAAAADGFEAAPTVSQAEALLALGISEQFEGMRARAAADFGAFAEARAAVDTLLDPTDLGRIRVLVQSKGAPLDGLRCLQPMTGPASPQVEQPPDGSQP